MGEPILRDLEEALSKIPELKKRYESYQLGHPLVGSSEWQDRRAEWGGAWPGSFGSIKLSVSVDHLFAWHCLCSPPAAWLPMHAHMTLLRSAIESAAQARWLLDPTADSSTRIRRALGYRLEDLGEGRKAEDVIQAEAAKDPSLRSAVVSPTAAEKIQALRSEADAWHLASIPMCNTVDLLMKYPQGSGHSDVVVWRLMSGVSHGDPWAVLQGPNDVVSEGATMTTYKGSADPAVAAWLTNVAGRHVAQAIEDWRQYLEPPPPAQ